MSLSSLYNVYPSTYISNYRVNRKEETLPNEIWSFENITISTGYWPLLLISKYGKYLIATVLLLSKLKRKKIVVRWLAKFLIEMFLFCLMPLEFAWISASKTWTNRLEIFQFTLNANRCTTILFYFIVSNEKWMWYVDNPQNNWFKFGQVRPLLYL